MSPELWALIGVIVVQAASMYINYQTHKANAPLVSSQAQGGLGDAMESLGQEYSRMLGRNKELEEELSALRPLTLKIALQEQAMQQTHEDKDDWKNYAEKLAHQLEEHEILPLPFRRMPSTGDTGKMKAVTNGKMKVPK